MHRCTPLSLPHVLLPGWPPLWQLPSPSPLLPVRLPRPVVTVAYVAATDGAAAPAAPVPFAPAVGTAAAAKAVVAAV